MTTARGDLPVLNRQASLEFTVPAAPGPTPYLYRVNTDITRLTFAAGEWSIYYATGATDSFGNAVNVELTAPIMASALLPATFIDVALTDSNGLNIFHHLVNIGGQVFVFGPGDAQVVWTSTFVTRATSENYLRVTVEGGVLTGDDFEITVDGGLSIGFSELVSVRPGAARSHGCLVSYHREGHRKRPTEHPGG